jgi:CTP:molybdopterin cytidylyltransferase MocA
MTTFRPETTPKVVISCIRQTEVAGVVKVIESAIAGEDQEVVESQKVYEPSQAAAQGGCQRHHGPTSGRRVTLAYGGGVAERVAGILLAAGAGSRLGQAKALVEVGGETLAARGVALLQAGGADPVILVTGAVPMTIPQALAVHNPDWSTGMGSSLATGLRALAETDAVAAVIALADQPLVGVESVRRLIAAYRDGASVAVAAYDGKPRNPVLIAREHWSAVIELATGDAGARPFLRARPELVTQVECGDTGSPDDVDTAEDLARVRGVATVRSEEKS